jgi:hypothetical protein
MGLFGVTEIERAGIRAPSAPLGAPWTPETFPYIAKKSSNSKRLLMLLAAWVCLRCDAYVIRKLDDRVCVVLQEERCVAELCIAQAKKLE